MGDNLDEVVFNIRACIISFKGPVPVRSLLRDYKELVGSLIPYKQFNYPTLESFLQSLPSLRVTKSGSDTMVEAATSGSSSHISSLVSKQKTTKKRLSPARKGVSSSRSYGQGRGYQPGNYLSKPPPRLQRDQTRPQPRPVRQEDRRDQSYNKAYPVESFNFKERKPQYEAPRHLYKPLREDNRRDQPYNQANFAESVIPKVPNPSYEDMRPQHNSLRHQYNSLKQENIRDQSYKKLCPPEYQSYEEIRPQYINTLRQSYNPLRIENRREQPYNNKEDHFDHPIFKNEDDDKRQVYWNSSSKELFITFNNFSRLRS